MSTWTRFSIYSTGGTAERPVLVNVRSNDDNDDGYDDGEIQDYDLTFRDLEAAFKTTGRKTHRGAYGQPVRVFLDGEEQR